MFVFQWNVYVALFYFAFLLFFKHVIQIMLFSIQIIFIVFIQALWFIVFAGKYIILQFEVCVWQLFQNIIVQDLYIWLMILSKAT